jgi:hypothetical protein
VTIHALRGNPEQVCKQVKDLLLAHLGRHEEISGSRSEGAWRDSAAGVEWTAVDAHVSGCKACGEFAQEMIRAGIVKDVMRRVTAPRGLVRDTQMRVRLRAQEIRQYRERMWPVWLSCALACIWALASMPVVWQGAEWIARNAQLPSYVWQPMAVLLWLMPAGLLTSFALYMKGEQTFFGEAETE